MHKVPADCEDDNLSDGLGDNSEFNQSLHWMQRLNVIGDEIEMLKMFDDESVLFSGGKVFEKSAELSLSTNSHLNIDIKPFDLNDYYEIVQKLNSSEIQINVMATGIVVNTFVKILE